MLSLGKLAPGQQQYYLDTVARGAEEYYTGAKEAPGQWIGAGAPNLGLAGEVDADELGHVLEHVDPSGTYRLTAAHSVPMVAGFDATFCAPKSVSLLFALGSPEVSNEVRNAADAAVRASVEVLEQAACRVRRGQGGHTVLDGDGFVAAAFRHRTSRAGDPHLHTHVVIANLAHSPRDDRWTALDARPLYAWSAAVGHLYEAQLRWELTGRLGVEWGPVRNGIADIAGIPKPFIREFSTRRREIEAHLAEHGQDSARAAQLATYATRRAKDNTVDAEGLLPGWRTRAGALGFDQRVIDSVLDRVTAVEPPSPASAEAKQLYQWLASPDGLTARSSTFGERDVIKAICNALPAGGRVDQVLGLVDGFVASEYVIAIGTDRSAASIHRADGTVIPSRTDQVRFTTPEMLRLEADLLDGALSRRTDGVAVASEPAIDAAVAERPSLTDEQERMVRTICSSGAGIDIVEGVAGAGKTYALAAAREAWAASGYRVIGCALAARAAQQLQTDAGIPASTIARLLGRIDRHETAFDDTTVLVVDEAAMVGTRQLAELLGHAEAADTKVILVGDPCQLPEIEAGGAFRGLEHRLGASQLGDNRRQAEAWERNTLAELRTGDPERALDSYLEHDRVHHAGSTTEMRELLVDNWVNAWLDGDDALMVAARLNDVDDLNRRARAVLQEEGYLGDDRVVFAGHGFTEGDRVLALRNDHRLGVLNGTRAVIEQIDTSQQQMTLDTTGGERLVVPFRYAEAGHLTHGYATTIHKAQGATVDRSLVLLDDTTDREHAYTAMSRGRYGNELFAVSDDHRGDERHAAEIERQPLDGIRMAIGRSAGKELALDQVTRPSTSLLDERRQERDALQRQLGDRPPDVSSDYRQLAEAHQREQHYRDGAAFRLDNAKNQLDRLGPIARHTRRSDRRELEQRIGRFQQELGQHDAKLGEIEKRLRELQPAVAEHENWQRERQPDLDRLGVLDREVRVIEALERGATRELTRGLDRGAERGVGRGLGIEL